MLIVPAHLRTNLEIFGSLFCDYAYLYTGDIVFNILTEIALRLDHLSHQDLFHFPAHTHNIHVFSFLFVIFYSLIATHKQIRVIRRMN